MSSLETSTNHFTITLKEMILQVKEKNPYQGYEKK